MSFGPREGIQEYAELVYNCAVNGLAFPESPFPSLQQKAREYYDETARRMSRELLEAKRIRVVKCHSCGAPLTRSKCAYCGTSHVVSRGT